MRIPTTRTSAGSLSGSDAVAATSSVHENEPWLLRHSAGTGELDVDRRFAVLSDWAGWGQEELAARERSAIAKATRRRRPRQRWQRLRPVSRRRATDGRDRHAQYYTDFGGVDRSFGARATGQQVTAVPLQKLTISMPLACPGALRSRDQAYDARSRPALGPLLHFRQGDVVRLGLGPSRT